MYLVWVFDLAQLTLERGPVESSDESVLLDYSLLHEPTFQTLVVHIPQRACAVAWRK